ncbi:MAG: Thiosulfate sulfurtransferase, rhodanese, partial [uncultured Pseudonocardia sp.]
VAGPRGAARAADGAGPGRGPAGRRVLRLRGHRGHGRAGSRARRAAAGAALRRVLVGLVRRPRPAGRERPRSGRRSPRFTVM